MPLRPELFFVRHEGEVRNLIDQAVKRFGRLDAIVPERTRRTAHITSFTLRLHRTYTGRPSIMLSRAFAPIRP